MTKKAPKFNIGDVISYKDGGWQWEVLNNNCPGSRAGQYQMQRITKTGKLDSRCDTTHLTFEFAETNLVLV